MYSMRRRNLCVIAPALLLHRVSAVRDSRAWAGDGMNPDLVYAMRHQLNLLHCPKSERRVRVVRAMRTMYAKGHSEADVKAVIGTSASAWQRARTWYREDTPETKKVSEQDVAFNPKLQRRLTDPNVPSWLRTLSRETVAREMRQRRVFGADVGDPLADAHYIAWRTRVEAREAEAERKRREEVTSGHLG